MHRPGPSERAPRATPVAGLVGVLAILALVATSCSGHSSAAGSGPSLSSPARPAASAGPSDAAPGAAPADTGSGTPVSESTAGLPAGWTPDPLRWGSCPDSSTSTCATLRVPLDWSEPTGAQIDLALAKVPSTGPTSKRLGTLVVNPGGPGGSGVEFVESDPFAGTLANRFDQVGWDPRGVGGSTAVSCGKATSSAFLEADPDPDTTAEQTELDDLARAVSADCAEHDANLLAHIGTRDVARDLEAIRRALDDGPLNYVGFSYGTQIGQDYAEMFPGQVRALVLDGVVDPSLTFTEFLDGQIGGFDAAFLRSAKECTDAGATRCGVGDLAAAYDRVHDRVERAPLDADDGRRIGPSDLAIAAIYTAYLPHGWRTLGPALADALDGDGSSLADLADNYRDLGGYGAYAGVVCIDTPPPSTPAAWQAFSDGARRLSPRFGGSVANELLPCATWPVRSTAAPAPVVAPDAPPILVVGNTGDPATPLANAQAVASHLRSGVLLTVDISGHTAYGRDSCATSAITSYLIDLTVPAVGTRC